MAGGRLVDARRLDELKQAELHRVVAVGGGRLALHHHARSRFQQRDRHYLPVRPEHLRHSDLFAKNSWTHVNSLSGHSVAEQPRPTASATFSLTYFAERLDLHIHTGRQIELHQRVYRLLVGSRMSSSRLCVRISNCSRDFLSTCGDRNTVVIVARPWAAESDRRPVRRSASPYPRFPSSTDPESGDRTPSDGCECVLSEPLILPAYAVPT